MEQPAKDIPVRRAPREGVPQDVAHPRVLLPGFLFRRGHPQQPLPEHGRFLDQPCYPENDLSDPVVRRERPTDGKVALPEILFRHPREHRRPRCRLRCPVCRSDPVLVEPAYAAVPDEHHPVGERLDRRRDVDGGRAAAEIWRRGPVGWEALAHFGGGEKRLDEGFVDPGTQHHHRHVIPFRDQRCEFEAGEVEKEHVHRVPEVCFDRRLSEKQLADIRPRRPGSPIARAHLFEELEGARVHAHRAYKEVVAGRRSRFRGDARFPPFRSIPSTRS